jgi:hypothetical protein
VPPTQSEQKPDALLVEDFGDELAAVHTLNPSRTISARPRPCGDRENRSAAQRSPSSTAAKSSA